MFLKTTEIIFSQACQYVHTGFKWKQQIKIV